MPSLVAIRTGRWMIASTTRSAASSGESVGTLSYMRVGAIIGVRTSGMLMVVKLMLRSRNSEPAHAANESSADYLVNNAGRSIRRGIANSFDRFHDFERTMQLNYFGAVRLILGFLPGMIERKRGHVINISSIGVLSNAPRFSAYVASKSALDSFAACAA